MLAAKIAEVPLPPEADKPVESRLKKIIDAGFYLFPLIFLGFAVIDMFSGISEGHKHLVNWKFVGNIIFANSTHVGLTFGLLMTNASMRAWIVERYGSIVRFWCLCATAFIIMSALIFAFVWTNLKSSDYFWVKVYLMLHSFVATQHALSQSTGIYGATVFGHLKNTANFPEFSSALRGFALIGTGSIIVINHIDTFKADGNVLSLHTLALLPFFASFFYLYWRRSKVDMRLNLKEGAFSSRFVLWLLYPFSFYAPVSVAAIHGLEYIKVASHMISYRFKLLLLTPFLIYIGIGLANTSFGIPSLFYDTDVDQIPFIFALIGSMGLSGTYLHYYLDRQIFKMREASTRKNVLPLLKNLYRFSRF